MQPCANVSLEDTNTSATKLNDTVLFVSLHGYGGPKRTKQHNWWRQPKKKKEMKCECRC